MEKGKKEGVWTTWIASGQKTSECSWKAGSRKASARALTSTARS